MPIGGLLNSINPLAQLQQLAEAVKNGDFKALLSTVSSLAMTFATGGAGALAGPLMSALTSFGSQALATGLMNKIVSMVGQQVIQQMGDKLGLDQKIIDAAQGAFCEACGDKAGARQNFSEAGYRDFGTEGSRFGRGVSQGERNEAKFFLSAILGLGSGSSPVGRGQADNTAGGLIENIQNAMQEMFNDLFNKEVEKKGDDLKKGGKDKEVAGGEGRDVAADLGIDTGSFLMKFALLLGSTIDKKTDDMMKLAREMNQKSDSLGDIQTAGKKDTKGQQEFQKQLSQTNSELGQMSSMLNALGKEIQTLQEALKSSLDAIGQAQAGLARKN